MSLRTRPFGCARLEALFRHQQLHRAAGDLLRLLSILVPIQLLLALLRVPQPEPSLLWLAGSASLGLALALGLACTPPSAQHPLVPLCALWLCSHPLALLPWPGLALLPSLMAVFLLYAFFPFPLLCSGAICFGLSMAQLASMFTVGGPTIGFAKVLAALLAHIWVHVVGIYAFLTAHKIGRAVFLNARNALDSDRELQGENKRMANLLTGSLPPHIVRSVQSQLGGSELPRVFVEHFSQCSVVFARLYGLPSILAQLQVPDSARLLNEFDWRLRTLAEASGLLLLPSQSSESVLALSGVPSGRADHAAMACQFGTDLLALVHSFGVATSAQLQARVGIGSGSLSAGIVGSRRWHYDVLGMAVDAAMHLEGICPASAVLLSEDTWRQLAGSKFTAERLAQGAWQLSGGVPAEGFCSTAARPLLFPAPPRRFSLLTLPQAVLRLLQQPPRGASTTTAAVPVVTPFTKRSQQASNNKAGAGRRIGSCRQLDSLAGPPPAGLHSLSLRFEEPRLDRAFHAQPDRWLIPGLALSVLFLALFGLFQTLAMPRMLPNLATLGLALCLMFLLLLALYVNFLESFCQFVTRTALGHSVAVLLVLAALCTCGLANTFSCPLTASPSAAICQPVQLPAVSLALWMFLPSLFVRLSSLLSLLVLSAALGLFCLHLFLTHAAMYPDLLSRLDLLAALLGLALLLFLLARRNEMLLRLDFLALLKVVEDGRQLERAEFLNDQILLNALPAHIAFNFAARTEPFAHLCPSVGVLCARLGRSGDWVGEFGFDRLNRLVCEVDTRLGQLSEKRRLEKVRSAHCYYTAACGILPEMATNVHDAPCTIGEQLAALADLAEFIQEVADAECLLDVAIGIDCGAALSVVVGGDRPRYELLGQPVSRARKLAEAASALGGGCVLLSEDVFLALRPRSEFHFDERSALSVAPGLVAYSLLRHREVQQQPAEQPKTPEPQPPPPPPHRGNQVQQPAAPVEPNAVVQPQIRSNPLADGLLMSSSAQSLCSSELFSVDLSVETDSLELEWVTPEMVANGQYGNNNRAVFPSEPANNDYKAERAGFYSELSVAEGQQNSNQQQQLMKGFWHDKRRFGRPMTGGGGGARAWPKSRRSSGANTSAFGSELSLPAGRSSGQLALDRLNMAANKVDRMLKEMAAVGGHDPAPECPFPREWATNNVESGTNSAMANGGTANRRDNNNSACRCLSEYENNEESSCRSLAYCSDSDAAFGGSSSRLDRLRRALLRGGSRNKNVKGPRAADGNEADRSGSPSVNSSQVMPVGKHAKGTGGHLLGTRWRHSSAHSIGYEDEYELASAPLSSYSSSAISLGWEGRKEGLPSVGENSLFAPIDAEDDEAHPDEEEDKAEGGHQEDAKMRKEMLLQLTRDIRSNFGDFQLASFPADSMFDSGRVTSRQGEDV